MTSDRVPSGCGAAGTRGGTGMRLTLETTYQQTITVDDATAQQLIADWENGDESLVLPAFDGAEQCYMDSRLWEDR